MPNLVKIAPSGSKILMGFDNGEAYEVAALDLRFECPCATCVDEITGRRTLKKETLKPDVRPTHVEPVGNYGILIEWSDRHKTGMYHFDRLYEFAKKTGSQRDQSI